MKYILTILLLMFTTPAHSQELPLYATSCETIRGQERKPSVISRAADKAIFDAISNLEDLFYAKNSLAEGEFNILVYKLIDNNVSDLKIQTTTSNDLEVCVEINGYLSISDIELPKQVKEPQDLIPQEAIAKDKPFVCIAPTKYYNNTESQAVSNQIKPNFENNSGFYLTDKTILADYVITPHVLKAKIDPINSQTNRFHMVVSLELENLNTQEIIKEHQNKFILIEAKDDEQQKAQELMQKLFNNASKKLLSKLEVLTNTNQDFLQAQ